MHGKQRAQQWKEETYALYLAARDPRVPWYARVLLALVVGYTLSPLDLIPDSVPVSSYLDDLVLVPLGILLMPKLIPAKVLKDSRAKAAKGMADRLPQSRLAEAIVALIGWLSWPHLPCLSGALLADEARAFVQIPPSCYNLCGSPQQSEQERIWRSSLRRSFARSWLLARDLVSCFCRHSTWMTCHGGWKSKGLCLSI